MSEIKNLEPKIVWEQFYNLTQTPRPSKKEEKAVEYLINFAKENNFSYDKDSSNNVIIRKDASKGCENKESIVIQNHIDMVCEKNDDTEFNFDTDPIETYIDGEWVTAKGTTLGADNGIGAAMGLAILLDKDLKHGPLEVLFTTDEEEGMGGAIGLSKDFIKSRKMINIDTEEEGAIYIGCAGGKSTTFDAKFDEVEVEGISYNVSVKGLLGGHSGLMIDQQLGNAIKLLARVLVKLKCEGKFLHIVSLNGGDKHNAIPREAGCKLILGNAIDKDAISKEFTQIFRNELKGIDEGVEVKISDGENYKRCLCFEDSMRVVDLILAIPHGVQSYSKEIHGLVESSTNLASFNIKNGELSMVSSQRSSVSSKVTEVSDSVKACGNLAGVNVETGDGYPAWQPNFDSDLVKKSGDIYKKLFNKEVGVKVIHAGLECGLLSEKYPDMEMISVGPDITGAHSPDESLKISSVKNVYTFVRELVESL
ncbi:MAG: cytosol nonspecific dipeptidase [Candidatus Cloacimonadota bacterium]|nr:MAG: cytosol nonspecific dipeptidase [Candidatus Cloacimonadota bacterium]PIE80622.1 MAG: cytosol nonspecific dipeptidase [Candidatus Delongbacteria bacterium]